MQFRGFNAFREEVNACPKELSACPEEFKVLLKGSEWIT